MKSSFLLFHRLDLGCGVTFLESRGLLIMNNSKVVALCSSVKCSVIPPTCEEYQSESLSNDTCCYLLLDDPFSFVGKHGSRQYLEQSTALHILSNLSSYTRLVPCLSWSGLSIWLYFIHIASLCSECRLSAVMLWGKMRIRTNIAG